MNSDKFNEDMLLGIIRRDLEQKQQEECILNQIFSGGGHPNVFADIVQLHETFNAVINNKPSLPDSKTKALRYNLICEEHDELRRALDKDDLVEIADGIVDCIVVLLGTAVSYGIPFNECWDEVHRSNMAKVGPDGKPIMRADGKCLKPEGWQRPRLKEILAGRNKI